MGRKSYSRQAMQKFTQQTAAASIANGVSTRLLDFTIPEEIVVKRFVIQVVPAVTGATAWSDGLCIASFTQSDSNNPDAGDPLDSNRLVRSGTGSVGSPLNLDDTITMRKMAGSGLHVYVENLGPTTELFVCKCTIHYLEV